MSENVTNLKSLRLVWFAMLVGQVSFALIAYALRATGAIGPLKGTENEQLRMTTIYIAIGIVLLAATTAASLFLPLFFKPGDARQPPSAQTLASRQIVRMALIEGSSLYGSVVYLLTGSMGGLALVAIAIAVYATTTYPADPDR